MRPEQLLVIQGAVKGDMFAILPTGYGNSACLQCLLFVLVWMSPCDGTSIVLVVTPLTAIMKDHVGRYKEEVAIAVFIMA